jgi:hypothetical protein
MQDLVQAFVADLPDASTRQKEVIETVAVAKGCELLIVDALQHCGLVQVVDGRILVEKAGEELARFLKLKLDALRLLPPERRAKTVQSLSEYLTGTAEPDVVVSDATTDSPHQEPHAADHH